MAFNTAGLKAYYTRQSDGASVAITLVTMVAGAWASGGFIEVDAANKPGEYQIGMPDAASAIGELYVDLSLNGAANMFDTQSKLELVNQIFLGPDNKVEVSSNAHTSGQTIAANAAIDTTAGKVDAVALVDTTTANTDVTALSAKTSTLAIPKNAVYSNFKFRMLLTADNQAAVGVTVTGERCIDGGAFEAVTGTITEISNGWYDFTSSAADTNGDSIAWNFAAVDCNDSGVSFQTVR